VHKLLSSPAFHLKGTGWYATDYSKKDKGHSPETDKGGAASESAAGDGDKASKASKDSKDSGDSRDSRDSKDSKDSRDSRESKESKASKESKDSKDAKARDSSGVKESGTASSKESTPPTTSSKS
jgi:hypothetical protein